MIEQDLVWYWRSMAAQCQLGEPQRMIKSYQALVQGHTLLICELCLQRSGATKNNNSGGVSDGGESGKDGVAGGTDSTAGPNGSRMVRKGGVGSAIPLPVWREDAFGCTWMCRPCRRSYFERHPEPQRCSRPSDYTIQVMNMWQMCSVPMLSVSSSSSAETDVARTNSSSGEGQNTSLPVIPVESPECLEHPKDVGQGIVMEARRHHGGDIGILAHHSDSRINHQLRRRKRKLLSTLLGLSGLKLRADSKLCGRYLMGSMDNPFRIAEVMKEMDWYYEETNYVDLMDSGFDSAGAKVEALHEWIEDTVERFGIEEAKDAYKRSTSGSMKDTGSGSEAAGRDSDPGQGDPMTAPEPKYRLVGGELTGMRWEPPPESLWTLIDTWLDHWQQDDHDYRPPTSLFDVDCEVDDAED